MKVEINKAREICDIVRKNFPYESPWMQYKIGYKDLVEKNIGKRLYRDVIELNKRIAGNKKKLDSIRSSYQSLVHAPLHYFEEMIKSIQKYKVQNCAETARIGYLVSRMNFVKDSDVTLGSLTAQTIYNKKEEDFMLPELDQIFSALLKAEYGTDYNIIDHVVTKIKGSDKKTFIVDSLLNETGVIEDVEKSYKTKYTDIFDVEPEEAVRIIDYICPPNPFMPRITDEEAKILAKKYQFLVLDENKDEINETKKHFFGLLER